MVEKQYSFSNISIKIGIVYQELLEMMTFLKNKNQLYEVIFHILFWVIHFVYRLYLMGYFYTYDSDEFYTQSLLLPVRIGATYFTIYFVLRRYLFRKRLPGFLFWLIVSVIVTVFIRRIVLYEVIFSFAPQLNYDQIVFWNFKSITHSVIYIYPVITLAVIIYVVLEWFKKEKLRLETQKEKLEAELKYLKNQINPHFLFNTINNIYSLVLEKSTKAPAALLKLSDMLNYLLYESNTDKIHLSKEIQNLQDYIELEKFRYGDKLKVIFNYEVRSGDLSIPPLLLLPFVENSFKHGAGESLKNSWIHITLNEENHHLIFKVENSVDENVAIKNGENGGIGLSNVKKRLELMFHNKHKLKTLKSSESFIMILQLDLRNEKK